MTTTSYAVAKELLLVYGLKEYPSRSDVRTPQVAPRRRRRRGDGRYAGGDAAPRVPRAAGRHRRSGAAGHGEGGHRPDAPRRAAAGDQRVRGPQDRQGELSVR